MHKYSFLLIATFSLTAVMVGCKSGPALHVKAAPFAAPAGWVEGKSDEGDVQLAIPAGWRQGVDTIKGDPANNSIGMPNPMGSMPESGNPELDKTLGEMAKGLDEESKKMEQEELARLKEKGIVLNVISVGNKPIPGESRTRFFVMKKDMGSTLSREDAAREENKRFLHKVVAENVELPLGPAMRFAETRQLVDGATFTTVSYVAIEGSKMYSLRFITEESPTVITSIEKQVAQTWRINAK